MLAASAGDRQCVLRGMRVDARCTVPLLVPGDLSLMVARLRLRSYCHACGPLDGSAGVRLSQTARIASSSPSTAVTSDESWSRTE